MNAKLIYTFYTVPYDGAISSMKGFSVIATHEHEGYFCFGV